MCKDCNEKITTPEKVNLEVENLVERLQKKEMSSFGVIAGRTEEGFAISGVAFANYIDPADAIKMLASLDKSKSAFLKRAGINPVRYFFTKIYLNLFGGARYRVRRDETNQ